MLPWLFVLVLCFGAEAKDVSLSWDHSPSGSVVGYKIYYKVGDSTLPFDAVGSPISVGYVTSYNFTGLHNKVVHYFAITAFDAAGYESSYSNIVESQLIENKLPSKVQGFRWQPR